MKFGILGPIQARSDERPLELGGRRQQMLLALLLLNANRPISSDALIEEMWGADSAGAGKRLSVAVSRLRRALEPRGRNDDSPLRTVTGGYLLALEPDDFDASRFEVLAQAGLDALDADAPAEAGTRLRDAVALWRGPAFGELGSEDALRGEAQRLEELRLVALQARFDADLQLGANAGVIPELRSLLGENQTREGLARLLMTALYRSGRQAEALEVYTSVRARLQDELGLEPGPELRTLQLQILRQSPSLDPVPSSTRWSGGDPARLGPVVTMLVALTSPSAAPERDGTGAIAAEIAGLRARHRALRVVRREDGWLVTFPSAEVALAAALDLATETRLAAEPAAGDSLHLRLGVHTGRLRIDASGSWGEDVHLAAALAGAANDGQALVSAATAALASDAFLTDLGERRIDDFAISMRVFGLGAGPHRVPRTGDPLRSNLPTSGDRLIGRERERAELMAMLGADEDRLVTITGPGGSGKTSLALAVAEEWVQSRPDGAFLVPLAQISDPAGIAAAIAAPLGIPLRPDDDPREVLGRALSGRELLLVLDNFEHVLDAAPLLADLLARATLVRALVTSQSALRLRLERVLPLTPLELPAWDDPQSVADAPATQLLILRARRSNPSFELTGENAAGVARLARALNGLPLAIELAAARLTLLSPVELLARLDRGIEALGHGSRDLPERQRGLRAALDWTHGLLTDDEATLLRRLGVFAGPVSLDRIEPVCGRGDRLDALLRLHDLSLVTQTGDGRLLLHPGVRRYAREKLLDADERDELTRRHADAFAEAAEGWGRRLLFDIGAIETIVVTEEPDIAQALTWTATNDLDRFARLAGGAAPALLFTARLGPWSEPIERTLTNPATLTDDDSSGGEALTPGARAWLLLAGGLAAFQRREVGLARARLQSACTAAERSGEDRLASLMRTYLIIFGVLAGTTEGLRQEHTALTERARTRDDRELLALVHGLEPYILAYCEGRHSEAAILWAGLAEDRTRADFAAWTAPYCLPDCQLLAGDHADALVSIREALQSARERGQPPTVAYQLEGMAIALAGLDRHEDAFQAAGWADSVRRTAGPAVNEWFRRLLAKSISDSRAALDSQLAAEAYARGLALPLDAAIDAALALDDRRAPTTSRR